MNINTTKRAKRELKYLHKSNPKQAKKIIDSIYKIGANPYLHGAIKLTDLNEYRFRVGNYRILYCTDRNTQIVTIISVLHRKDAYRF